MRTVVVTGSASGIGAATRRRLEGGGARVVGVDIRDAEVIADLASADGRRAALDAVRATVGSALDGLVACAGLGPQSEPASAIVAVNYFGAEAMLSGLRPLLAAGTEPAAVAVSSNSSTLPNADSPLVAACLAGDEKEARRVALTLPTARVYAGAKLALARWVRRHAPGTDWAGSGLLLNAVAPGAVRTPLLEAVLADPTLGPAIRDFPIPTGGFGHPDDVAAAIVFLLGPDARFFCGSVVFCDGGTDALFRPDAY